MHSLKGGIRAYEARHGRNVGARRMLNFFLTGGAKDEPSEPSEPSKPSRSVQNIVFGIEIEGCFDSSIADTKLEYFNVEDEMIDCERGDALEFISVQLQLDTFKRADFQKEYQFILQSNFGCAGEDGHISCGTHVHMSMRGFTKRENQYFRLFLLMEWMKVFDTLKHTYYKHQNRHRENSFCEPNTLNCLYRDRGKDNMLRFVTDPDTDDWHVEFRGFGEVVSKGSQSLELDDPDYWPPHNTSRLFNAYIADLASFYVRTVQAYERADLNNHPDALVDQLASFAETHGRTSQHTFLSTMSANLTQAQHNPLDPLASTPQAKRLLEALNRKLEEGAPRKQMRR